MFLVRSQMPQWAAALPLVTKFSNSISRTMTKKWIGQIFKSKQAQNNGVARRSVRSVMKNASMSELKHEVARRGFQMRRIGKQCVIACIDLREKQSRHSIEKPIDSE